MLETLKNGSLVTGGLLLAVAMALAGCGNLSRVSDEGSSNEPAWPEAEDVTFATGAYPNVDDLRLVGSGMTKDQLYNLLGRPHFGEGLVGVREWDYLFHFRTPEGDVTCQYKVLFDKDKLARTFLWKPQACADRINPSQAAAPTAYSLNSDVLFAFGSATLTAAGQAEVEKVAAEIRQRGEGTVTVVGHTDRIGSDAANMTLSQRRAQAVRQVLVDNGIDSARVTARGAGESQPVVDCPDGPRSELVACLAPNRRVELLAAGRS
ncbi:MAG: OmpA family protein [Pusillimonas sp.]